VFQAKAEHDIHVLYCLPCRTFDQIIGYRQDYDSITVLRLVHGDAAKVGTPNGAGFRVFASGQYIDKGFVLVTFLV
jgi:hypothetical protein